MSSTRTIRIVLWGLVGLALIAAASLGLGWYVTEFSQKGSLDIGKPVAEIGGPFTLTDTKGNKVSDTDFAGRPRLMYFGFTYCPDVCPTTLSELTSYLEELGDKANELAVIFITVDPERDSGQQLGDYLEAFDSRIIGLTGSKEELDPVLDSFRVYRKKVPLEDGDYTMDHTAAVYLMNRKGEFVGTIAYQEDSKTAMEKLRRLIAGS